MPLSDTTEQQIIAAVLAGQSEQYRALVEHYHQGLIVHLTNMIGDQAQAEDVAQEAFIQAFNKLGQYVSRYAFSTWLYKIAHNLAYRHLQQAQRTVQLDERAEQIPDQQASTAERLDLEQTKQLTRQAIQTLSPDYRQVVSLYYWENLSYEEIATVLEKPVGTVRTWLHRAKQELGKELYGQAR
jgi:RNA polymerase sigma-70 factor (ECF subfamily)